MPRVVQRRPHQVVHRRVDDGEVARRAGLQHTHARQKHAGVPDQAPSRLEQQPLAPPAEQREDHRRVIFDRHRRLVAIADAETAADVDVLERNAFACERIDEREQPSGCLPVRPELGDLRPDVHVDAAHGDRRHARGAAVEQRSVGECDAEFAFLESGRDVRMRERIDVRVYAKAHRRDRAHACRDAGELIELARGFDVEAEDARGERRFHLRLGLADAGEHDLARIGARGRHARKLAARHDVEAAAEAAEEIENRQRRVRFHRIADEVRMRGERAVERLERVFEQRARVHVRRRAEALGERGQRDALGPELAADEMKPPCQAHGLRSDDDDGGGSAGDVVAGGVAGLSIGGGGGVASVLGAGRSGPLMPHPVTPQSIASASAIASAPRRLN